MAILIVETDGQQVRCALDRPRTTVGRADHNDIVVDHPDIAEEHCAIERIDESDEYRVVDLGSPQGTVVRGRQVKRWNLMDGDEVMLGAVKLVFDETSTAPAAAKPAEAPPPAAPKRRRRETAAPREDSDAEANNAAPTAPPAQAQPPVPERSPEAEAKDLDMLGNLRDVRNRILGELRKVIVGQTEVVEQILLALLCNGHCLLVGLPGLAKTLLVQTLAQIFNIRFRRVQFTPDLMPADIIGTNVIQENITTGERSFKFIRGPLFTNILLADEINRTPPKTQAALLEAMQERSATIGGKTYKFAEPFFVLATQNPIEQEGTYPLPEAQLDRFMFNIVVNYPSHDEEARIYKQTTGDYRPVLRNVVTGDEILDLQRIIRRVPTSDYVIQFVTNLVRRTRPEDAGANEHTKKYVKWGAGPRAGQYLILGAKARAVLHGRLNIDLADVRAIAVPVMRHRIGVNFNAEAEGITSVDVIRNLLKSAQA